ncbi:hypothetical protein KP509_38G054300 [Ceratopteris richardii]|nr:hypothetical protein KP509_38G054300 [Ceratopteris richardii]
MTIEFLKMRLQAQRTEYKAEKQKSQQLARKVIELEQKLNVEIERRKKAEYNALPVSSTNHSEISRRFHHCNYEIRLTLKDSKSTDTGFGNEHSSTEFAGSDDSEIISPSFLKQPRKGSDQRREITNQLELQTKYDSNKITSDEELSNDSFGGSKYEKHALHTEAQTSKGQREDVNAKDDEEAKAYRDLNMKHKKHNVDPDECSYCIGSERVSNEPDFISETPPNAIICPAKSLSNCPKCEENHIPQSSRSVLCKDVGVQQHQIDNHIAVLSSAKRDETTGAPTIPHAERNEYVKTVVPLDIFRTLCDYEISICSPQRFPHS